MKVYGLLVKWYLQGRNKVLGEKLVSVPLLSTKNPTRIGLGSNLVFRCELATNLLIHGKSLKLFVHLDINTQ
jgi:hypothetical protein